jgi:hypothetical protein
LRWDPAQDNFVFTNPRFDEVKYTRQAMADITKQRQEELNNYIKQDVESSLNMETLLNLKAQLESEKKIDLVWMMEEIQKKRKAIEEQIITANQSLDSLAQLEILLKEQGQDFIKAWTLMKKFNVGFPR